MLPSPSQSSPCEGKGGGQSGGTSAGLPCWWEVCARISGVSQPRERTSCQKKWLQEVPADLDSRVMVTCCVTPDYLAYGRHAHSRPSPFSRTDHKGVRRLHGPFPASRQALAAQRSAISNWPRDGIPARHFGPRWHGSRRPQAIPGTSRLKSWNGTRTRLQRRRMQPDVRWAREGNHDR